MPYNTIEETNKKISLDISLIKDHNMKIYCGRAKGGEALWGDTDFRKEILASNLVFIVLMQNKFWLIVIGETLRPT